ncbi:MAG: PilZ domain-containing protein [Oscillibacter sp.]|nr:PilZ domain-containing protein [Oscillibacter sp.]MCI9376823.1 PilZ domain-containing protein [Oscillibacter sp.]
MKQEERTYMILDSQNNPIAPGQMVSPPGDEMLQVLVLENKIDDVARHEIIHLIAMGSDDASLQCQVLRERGDKVILKRIAALDPEVRRNLRVPVKFDSFVYPITGSWRGRRSVQSLDLSCGGVAFRGEAGLAEGEQVELVVPTVEAPLIMRCQILRVKELQDEKRLYATKFIDMCEDEEVTVRETVFSLQLQSRNQRIGSE